MFQRTTRMQSIQQDFSIRFQYAVHFTQGLFKTDNPLLARVFPAQDPLPKAYFVLDEGVVKAHTKLIADIEAYAQHYAHVFTLCAPPWVVPGGEVVKNELAYLKQVVQATEIYSIDRHSFILAIGGGAVLDMVGFAASVAHRGIRHLRIPTTVLAQNDSGVGVKNGVNYLGKKNFLGTFSPPYAVINDAQFLTTLNDRDWRSGIAEAIKVALIKDAVFWEFLEASATQLVQRDLGVMQRLIHWCAQLHMQHIASGDPFEMGSSRPLDFGHWAAHKLEQLTQYQVRHGEAVAIGIALDVTYAYLQRKITQKEQERIICLIRKLGFPLYLPVLSQAALLEGLEEFREHLGGQLTIMLLRQIGQGVEVHEMDKDTIRDAIALLEQMSRNAMDMK